jgi:hypothetical protein
MDRAWVVVVFASLASAHSLNVPKRDRLLISASEIRLTVDYSISAEEARTLRQIMRRPIRDHLVREATHFAALTVDGKAVALTIDKVTELPEAVRVELTAKVARPKRVRFFDRHKDRRITVPVEVVLEGLEAVRPLPPQPFVFADHPLELDLK